MTALIQSVLRMLGTSDEEMSKDDLLWKEWLELTGHPREPRDLKELLGSEVRDVFKKRALTILLAPDVNALPRKLWVCERRDRGSYLSLGFVNLSVLSETLLAHIAELVCTHVDALTQCEKIFGDKSGLMDRYNMLIIRLLELLPEGSTWSNAVYRRFQLRTYSSYCGLDDSSGYSPFHSLLLAPGVPAGLKEDADARMRVIVEEELRGRRMSRKDWEAAFPEYVRVLEMCAYDSKLRYNIELFGDQLEFLLSLSAHIDKLALLGWRLPMIMRVLADDKYRSLRLRFVQFEILHEREEGFGSFGVHCQESLVTAERLVEEFGEEDLKLAARLGEMIAKGKAKIEAGTARKSEVVRRRESLLARMS